MKYFRNIGIILILLALTFNFIETAYFGFNAKAMSHPEEICDTICKMLANAGLVFLGLDFLFGKHKS